MKKFLFVLFAVCFLFTACKEKSATPVVELNVEETVCLDLQRMSLNYEEDYRWFECCIVLQNFLDEENDGIITNITNIFQVVNDTLGGADVHVIFMTHDRYKDCIDVKDGFWLGDLVLNPEEIQLSFNEAFEKLMESNYPKPHSQQCVLRKELGPVEANPQYIFGNVHEHLYVDAVTGEVNNESPAYCGLNIGTPLGEWP